jgi:hypothetical protein
MNAALLRGAASDLDGPGSAGQSWRPRASRHGRPLRGEGGAELLAGGLGDRGCGAVPPDGFSCARYDIRVGVDLVGRADHPVDLLERAEGGGIVGRGHAKLGIRNPAWSLGWRRRWLAEDGMPHHRQLRGVDRGLVLVERHHMRTGQAIQGDGLRDGVCGVVADGVCQVGGAGQR